MLPEEKNLLKTPYLVFENLIMESSDLIIRKTRLWLEQFVIGLGLCPFAKKPFELEQIRYVVLEGAEVDRLTKKLLDELHFLNRIEQKRIETTLIIISQQMQDFRDFNDYLAVVEDILLEMNLIGEIQVASFHPEYQFAGTTPEDAENYTNRSPYPMLHLLREESVERALKNYPDPEKIPQRNIEKMKKLGLEKLKKWNDDIRKEN